MSAKCPACNKSLSPFGLRKSVFCCPSCSAKLRAETPTASYLGFRLLAGGIAAWFAAPFESCAICAIAIMLLFIGAIAYWVVSYATKVVLVTHEE